MIAARVAAIKWPRVAVNIIAVAVEISAVSVLLGRTTPQLTCAGPSGEFLAASCAVPNAMIGIKQNCRRQGKGRQAGQAARQVTGIVCRLVVFTPPEPGQVSPRFLVGLTPSVIKYIKSFCGGSL